eukprot:jgi/Botrbrau1/15536/Bobra.0333s0003.1
MLQFYVQKNAHMQDLGPERLKLVIVQEVCTDLAVLCTNLHFLKHICTGCGYMGLERKLKHCKSFFKASRGPKGGEGTGRGEERRRKERRGEDRRRRTQKFGENRRKEHPAEDGGTELSKPPPPLPFSLWGLPRGAA